VSGVVSWWRRAGAALAALVLTAAPASAHLVQTGFGTFYDGIVHLAMTPADLLVVLGLALLAGLRGQRASRAMLLALPGAWLAGGLLGASLVTAGELPWVTTVSIVVVGLLVALNARLNTELVVVLGCCAGALHGWVNGATMTTGGADRLALLGAALTAFTLVTLLAALVVSLRAQWARVVVRVAGSWIAAIGLLMLGWLARPGG
jgi:hydrogenase/urease accessory protein HupE